MKVAITGNIGSGKSTVCNLLKKVLPNYSFFSIDEEVARIYADKDFKAQLLEAYGVCEKAELSTKAFQDEAFRVELEHFFELKLSSALNEILEAHNVIVEFPTLFENFAWLYRFQKTVAVVASDETRRKRVLSRDKKTAEDFDAVNAVQLSSQLKAAAADVVINTETMGEHEIVQTLLAAIEPVKILEQENNRLQGFKKLFPGLYKRASMLLGGLAANKIFIRYTEAHRYYHGLNHLDYLLAKFDEQVEIAKGMAIKPLWFKHLPAIEAAIWYHDIVYSVDVNEYKSNEAQSAKAWIVHQQRDDNAFCQVTVTSPQMRQAQQRHRVDQISLAAELIVATKGHQITSSYLLSDPSRKAAAELFLDMDLSPLGLPWEDFVENDKNICLEWGQNFEQPSPEFCLGRMNALTEFAKRKQLYFSEEFKHLNDQAHKNLQRSSVRWHQKLDLTKLKPA